MVAPQLAESVLNPERRRTTFLGGCLDCIRGPRDHQFRHVIRFFDQVLRSVTWRVVIAIFTIVLLFGSPIQILFMPKSADAAFDIIYTLAFVVFVIDMMMNMLADPDYFGCDPFRRNRIQPFDQAKFCTCGLGSFRLWCDIVSTTALLFDISYVNVIYYREEVLELTLDDFGLLINMGDFNAGYPVEFQSFDSLVLVCKAARVARLIPSTKVVEISSRINFYWYIERMNPWWYYSKFREHQEASKREKLLEPKQGSGLSRRASWGGLEIAALAKVKAMADERRKKEQQLGFWSRTFERMKRGFRSVAFSPNTNLELKRHIAATKIQRAWRHRLARPIETRSMDGTDFESTDGDGWRARSSGGGTLERVLKKRTMLGNYGRQASRNCRGPYENFVSGKGGRYSSGGYKNGTRADSQVGTAMAEVTGQWVATIILIGMILTILFAYYERDATRPSTMVVLHAQILKSKTEAAARKAVDTAVSSVIPGLYEYNAASDTLNKPLDFRFDQKVPVGTLREREKLIITVEDSNGTTEGKFENIQEKKDQALVELLMTIFVLVVWFFGIAAFAGPVMTLVIIPIERMVRLLGMLTMDPLGYQTNSRFKKFMFEEDALVKNSQWTKEVLKGMETTFLMSTILRIGSLMKVGFGSAGVEIIRHNLQKGQNKNMLILNSQGSTVSCIFLFCDIRQFTDATECLQEEVFVFTNRIAAVVHSICHSYGGSANKNVGDAFLVSWLLEDDASNGTRFGSRSQGLVAKHNQADKALLSVVKICMSLHYDHYYVQAMSDNARTALLNKLKNRPGPVVQMGFGLHAGKAVQGAIGSQRKIDATYVSEAVERAEYLESSTKRYGLKMLMSDTFHRLLHSSNRRRCRKIDQIMFANEDEQDDDQSYEQGDIMELFTYDMDIDALWRSKKINTTIDGLETHVVAEADHQPKSLNGSQQVRLGPKGRSRRIAVRGSAKRDSSGSEEMKWGNMSGSCFDAGQGMVGAAKVAVEVGGSTFFEVDAIEDAADPGELALPSRPQLYSSNVWLQEDMRLIRHQYTSVVFQAFSSGLQRYYEKDWLGARHCFEAIMERFEDGPTQYFLNQMKKHNWMPPPDFKPFSQA